MIRIIISDSNFSVFNKILPVLSFFVKFIVDFSPSNHCFLLCLAANVLSDLFIHFLYQVNCKVKFIDFEGRSDGESIKRILALVLKPRQMVIVHGKHLKLCFAPSCSTLNSMQRYDPDNNPFFF